MSEVEQSRDEALERLDASADECWKTEALILIRRLAMRGSDFSADDVFDYLGAPLGGTSPRAIGAVFALASRKGWIVRTGFAPSRRASLHAHWISQWRGGFQ